MTSIVVGLAGDYSLSITNSNTTDMDGTASGGTLSGGVNPTGGTIYDSGTATATVNSISATVSYGQSSTPASIAQALASALNTEADGAITVSAVGSNIYLTSTQSGTGTDWPVSLSFTHDTTDFTTGSFTGSTSGMSGGVNASGTGTTIYGYSLTHASDGQIVGASDSVNGNWAYQ
jgi:phage tail sheath gpL-like